jgi:hypothetical protein
MDSITAIIDFSLHTDIATQSANHLQTVVGGVVPQQ